MEGYLGRQYFAQITGITLYQMPIQAELSVHLIFANKEFCGVYIIGNSKERMWRCLLGKRGRKCMKQIGENGYDPGLLSILDIFLYWTISDQTRGESLLETCGGGWVQSFDDLRWSFMYPPFPKLIIFHVPSFPIWLDFIPSFPIWPLFWCHL